jgi:hypothetical protein
MSKKDENQITIDFNLLESVKDHTALILLGYLKKLGEPNGTRFKQVELANLLHVSPYLGL